MLSQENFSPLSLLMGVVDIRFFGICTRFGRYECQSIPNVGYPSRNGVNTIDALLYYVQQKLLDSAGITRLPNNNAVYCLLLNLFESGFKSNPMPNGVFGNYGCSRNTLIVPVEFDNLTAFQIILLACAHSL